MWFTLEDPSQEKIWLTGNSWLMDWLYRDSVFLEHEKQTVMSRAGVPLLYCVLPGEGHTAGWE